MLLKLFYISWKNDSRNPKIKYSYWMLVKDNKKLEGKKNKNNSLICFIKLIIQRWMKVSL